MSTERIDRYRDSVGARTSIVCLVLSAATSDASPIAGSELAASDLGWPATTAAAVVRQHLEVFETADHGRRIGSISSGTRVAWKKIIATRDACKAWVALEPRGWVCARDLAPSAQPPSGNPSTPVTPVYKDKVAAIKPAGADAFDDLAQIKANVPARRLDERTPVTIRGGAAWKNVDNVNYVRTDQGWISAHDMWWYNATDFSGVELAPNAALDVAWAVAHRPGARIPVRDQPDAKAKPIRTLAPRERVSAFETKGNFIRIGSDEWVERGELRRTEKRTRPDGVAPTERWMDVDLDQQTIVLYDGDAPVYATLVATGKDKWFTPVGIYRIKSKVANTRMRDPGGMEEEWNVEDVPWVMGFRRNFALHGAYWHESFGRRLSHGCVNLSPTDAKRVYEFVTPDAPAGWTRVDVHDGAGTPMRIRTSWMPNPKWYDYEGKALSTTTAKR